NYYLPEKENKRAVLIDSPFRSSSQYGIQRYTILPLAFQSIYSSGNLKYIKRLFPASATQPPPAPSKAIEAGMPKASNPVPKSPKVYNPWPSALKTRMR